MSKTYNSISIVIPTKNEEQIVENNLKKIYFYAKNCKFIESFEILICDFSTDSTPKKVLEMSKKYHHVKYIKVLKKGIGAGINAGFERSSFDAIIFYPIDMSWDIKVLENSMKCLNEGYDVILGSRSASGSKVERPLDRRIFSFVYNILIRMFFGLKIKDTQGTVMVKKADYRKYKKKLLSDDPFLQTEILIQSKRLGLKIIEIPVVVTDTRKESKVPPLKTSAGMFSSILKEFFYS